MSSKHQFDIIKDCIQEDSHSYKFTITSLCESQDISRITLHRILKLHTGQSATNYINEVRLKKAYKMLMTLDVPIKEIAVSVGYLDPKYFTRLFKKKYGVTPSQIKERL